nr:helix-turn-helix domain-containing protein [Neoroseomonas terrae]
MRGLCAAIGVSRPQGACAFMATVGVSPRSYLKARRLMLAQRALRATESPLTLTKSVALVHGFSHHGHFARDTKALFGEPRRDPRRRPSRRRRLTPDLRVRGRLVEAERHATAAGTLAQW